MKNFLCKFAAASFESRAGSPPRLAGALPTITECLFKHNRDGEKTIPALLSYTVRSAAAHDEGFSCRRIADGGGCSPSCKAVVVYSCSSTLQSTVRELQTKTKEMENGGLLRTDWPGRTRLSLRIVVLVGAADALE
jgi:hypothetical protein